MVLHPNRPIVISGDLSGRVFYSNYQTGEIGGLLGEHTNSVETLCINPSLNVAASAGVDTHINIYNLVTME